MLRMAHRILSQGVKVSLMPEMTDDDEIVPNRFDKPLSLKYSAIVRGAIYTCPVFILDNIANQEIHLYRYPWKLENALEFIRKEYPRLRLPYDSMWFEFNAYENTTDLKGNAQVGYLSTQTKLENDQIVIDFTKFITRKDGQTAYSDVHKIQCKSSGEIVKYELFMLNNDSGELELCDACLEYRFMMISPVFKAICLCMCRNKPKEDDASEKFNPPMKWTSRQRLPRLKYKILDISGIKSPRSMNSESTPRGYGNSLHQVRGHFATYSEDRPLFGRLHGTFWIPSHARGDIKNGAVIKDYSVSPPATD